MDIKQSCLQGVIPEDLKIFDAHSHVGEGEYAQTFLYTLPLAESIRLSKKIGIKKMAASSLKALSGNTAAGNKRLFELIDIYPNYLYAYVHYAPETGENGIEEIAAYKGHPNFVGIKIHPREDKAPLPDGGYELLWPYLEANGILVLCHTWQTEPENDPAQFAPILARYPKLKLLLGHMGGTRKGVLTSCMLAARYENVYLDINGSLYSETWLEELARHAGIDKLIFSTDQVFNDPRIIVGRVVLSDLSDVDKRKILYYNFENMMGRKYI